MRRNDDPDAKDYEMPATTWTKPAHATFAADMEAAGYEVTEYRGRNLYHGPAVVTDTDSPRELQAIIRATSVMLIWDDLGKGLIVYPER